MHNLKLVLGSKTAYSTRSQGKTERKNLGKWREYEIVALVMGPGPKKGPIIQLNDWITEFYLEP